MKKYIVIAVIIALIAATPWYVGIKAQKELESQILKLNDYPGYNASFSEYNRGLLHSNGKIKISYDIGATPDDDEMEQKLITALQEGIILNVDVSHGPLLSKPVFGPGLSYTVITLDDSQETIREAEQLFAVDELLTVETRMKMNGDGVGTLIIPALNHSEEGKAFKFGGTTIGFELADFGKKYKSSGTIEAVTFSTDEAQFESSPIAVEGEGSYGESLYGTGTFSAKLASLKISGEKSVQLEQLDIDAEVTNPASGLMNIDYKIALAKVSGSDMPHALTDTVIDISANNLKESAFTKFSELGTQSDFSDPEAMAAYQQKMQAAMSELLAGSPELQVNNLAFKFGDDSWMDLKGKLSVDGAIAGKPEVQSNPFMLIPAITADYTANLSESLVEMAIQQYLSQQFADSGMSAEEIEQMTANQEQQTSMMIGQFVGMGFLQKTDAGYRIETSFKNGELLVNGNPIPVPF